MFGIIPNEFVFHVAASAFSRAQQRALVLLLSSTRTACGRDDAQV
jgi:hypothetical protein